jgi:hypothetical protein
MCKRHLAPSTGICTVTKSSVLCILQSCACKFALEHSSISVQGGQIGNREIVG